MAGVTVGLNCILYRNAGTHGSPTWTAMTSVKDVNLNLDITKAEAVARLSSFKSYAGGLISGPLEFSMLADTALSEYDVLKAGVLAKTVFDFAMANGPIATAGTEYWRADYLLFGWKRNEPLEESATIDVQADLAYSSNVPAFVTAS